MATRSPRAVSGSTRALWQRSYAKGFDDVQDGSSNTIALLEQSRSRWKVSGGGTPLAYRPGWGWGHSETGTGNNRTVEEVYSCITVQFAPNATLRRGAPSPNGFFINNAVVGSNHPGGMQVAMVDGSAKFINEEVNLGIFHNANGIDDARNDNLN